MQIQNEEWVAFVRSGGKVKRCHTIQVHNQESVAAHSWGVAILIMKFNPNASKQLLCAALTHDVTELFTGDVPAQVKWQYPDIKKNLDLVETQYARLLKIEEELTKEEENWLIVCDRLDLVLYALEELYMGNNHVIEMLDRLIEIMDTMDIPMQISAYYSFITNRYYSMNPKKKA